MKIVKLLLAVVLCSFVVAGCAPQRQGQVVQMQVKYTEATIIEGKTTKTEILQKFGNPDSFGRDYVAYDYRQRSPLDAAKIRYTQKDGTEFMVILQRGTDKDIARCYFTDDGILRYVHFN